MKTVCSPVISAQSCLPGAILTVSVSDRCSRVLLLTTDTLLLLHLGERRGEQLLIIEEESNWV